MTVIPRADEDIPAFWRALGLPGLIDVHTHFMPDNVMAKVWAFFDRAADEHGSLWSVRYRLSPDDRLAVLRGFGVSWFTAMLYPHKPDMARWLNGWAAEFAAKTPGCLHTATFYPEPSAAADVAEAIEGGARVFKAHVQVGAYDPRDPLLDQVWGLLAEAQIPVVVHCGSGPVPGPYTGPAIFAEVLARHPRLRAIVAHMGQPEYGEFLHLAERYPEVRLDTTRGSPASRHWHREAGPATAVRSAGRPGTPASSTGLMSPGWCRRRPGCGTHTAAVRPAAQPAEPPTRRAAVGYQVNSWDRYRRYPVVQTPGSHSFGSGDCSQPYD